MKDYHLRDGLQLSIAVQLGHFCPYRLSTQSGMQIDHKTLKDTNDHFI